jgi:hypothetical protein
MRQPNTDSDGCGDCHSHPDTYGSGFSYTYG